MKGKDILNALIRSEMPDIAQFKEDCIQKAKETGAKKRAPRRKRLILAAIGTAVAAVITIAVVLLPAPRGGNENFLQFDESIRGLPIQKYVLQHTGGTELMERRYWWNSLQSFFSEDEDGQFAADSFVIAEVTQTNVKRSRDSYTQLSTLRVLVPVWGEEMPESFQILQRNAGLMNSRSFTVYVSGGSSYMLRKGGVYLLPVRKYTQEEQEAWLTDEEYWVPGDRDVLFEIDDYGQVYAHTTLKTFSRFDGKPYTDLANTIIQIAQSPDLPLMLSPFGERVLTQDIALVEITEAIPHYDENSPYLRYNANVSFDLDESQRRELPLEYIFPDFADPEALSLQPGTCYLVIAYLVPEDMGYAYVGEELSVIRDNMAEVLPDGTIRALTDDGIFAEYNGYTVEEIRELVRCIRLLP
ncbi:MAG: hypothetical protein LBM28_00615 [Oscillospiraceae bacterium]|jgi:hypothetical protein|nr:hypothetical protein [Oscillospiraceae bacterium]